MLAAYPAHHTSRLSSRSSRAPLRIYSPPAVPLPPKSADETPATRTGEVQPIGQLLPHVLVRYLSLSTEE
jgi:hypothetical protein